MKNIVISFLLVAALASCGNSSTNSQNGADKLGATTKPSDPEAEKGLELIANSDCQTCHAVEEQLVGPSYRSVAAKYRDSSSALIDNLADRIINGSVGHWGGITNGPASKSFKGYG